MVNAESLQKMLESFFLQNQFYPVVRANVEVSFEKSSACKYRRCDENIGRRREQLEVFVSLH